MLLALVVLFALLAIALAAVIAHPERMRGPLQRAISASLHRQVLIGDMRVQWGHQLALELDDVTVANLPGGSEPQMARVRSVHMLLSPLQLLAGRIVVPRVALNDVDVLLERLKDDRRNWSFGDESARQGKPSDRLQLGSVSLTNGRVRFIDEKIPMSAIVQTHATDQQAQALSRRADTPPVNNRYAMRMDISGKYRGNPFSGQARSGNVVSLQNTGLPFPLQLDLKTGDTRLQMEGSVADVLQLSGVDMRMQIAGPTLANIYPLLLLPLPASPPYTLHGRLRRDGARYAIEDLGGRIGSTDLEGEGTYVVREPRPLLTVQLRSTLLDVTDLGPLIGVETKSRTGKPLSQAQLSTREQAAQTDAQKRGERVLPAGRFDPARLRLIDADFRLRAHRVKGLGSVPLADFDGVLRLRDAVLHLDPLKVGVAGGTFAGHATLDAREDGTLHSKVQADLRRVRRDLLIPAKSSLAKGSGLVDMSAELTGTGDSIADAAAKADGHIAATMYEGSISNLLDAASGLAIGRVLAVLATGDKEINLNCGAAAFDVHQGQGKSQLFVLDTQQTQVLGSGEFDLANETFNFHVEPKPKKKGLLSLRTPIDLKGTFSHADVSLEKKPLLERAGAALALGLVAPPAALLALIEPGTGKDTPCDQVLREADSAKSKVSASATDVR